MRKIKSFLRYVVGRTIKNTILEKIKTFQDISKKRSIVKDYKESPKYLNVGGCDILLPHWRSFDFITHHYSYDPILLDFNIDLEKMGKWPIEECSYDLVYTSHTFEHLSQSAVCFTLNEIYRILKPGGGLRITLPNIDLLVQHYKTNDQKWFEIHFPQRRWEIDHPQRKGNYCLEYVLVGYFASCLINNFTPEYIKRDIESMKTFDFLEKYRLLAVDLERRGKNPGDHRNWFTFEKLNCLLRNAGFTQIVESQYRQSVFTEFCNKGIDERVKELSIYIDALK